MRDRLKNIGLLCAGAVAACVIGEWAVRVFAPQKVYRFPQGLFVADRDLHYRLAPNFSGVATTGEFRTGLRTNGLGLREDVDYGPRQPGTSRVLAVGDSFTMGIGVESAEALPKVLEHRLRTHEAMSQVEVINAGVAGYNTRQAVTYLASDGWKLQPDLVVLNIFVGNDIHENLLGERITVVNGYLQSGDQPSGLLPDCARVLLSRSHLYQLVWPIQRRLFDPAFADEQLKRQRFHLSIYVNDDARAAAMWTPTWSELDRLQRLTIGRGFRLAVVVIPEILQTDRAAWQDATRPGTQYGIDRPNRRIVEYCRRADIPVLDLLPIFAGDEHRQENYFSVDGHWNARGHRLAAGALETFLLSRGLVPPGRPTTPIAGSETEPRRTSDAATPRSRRRHV